jgi:hypothetical protein
MGDGHDTELEEIVRWVVAWHTAKVTWFMHALAAQANKPIDSQLALRIAGLICMWYVARKEWSFSGVLVLWACCNVLVDETGGATNPFW